MNFSITPVNLSMTSTNFPLSTMLPSISTHIEMDNEGNLEEGMVYPWKVFWPSTGAIVLIENVIFILVICTCQELHTTKYVFTASLGLTDILVGASYVFGSLFYIPAPGIAFEAVRVTAIFRVIMGATIMSIIHIAMIALERYVYIAHPFFYEKHLTAKTLRWIIGVFWFFGFILLCFLVVIQWLMSTIGVSGNDIFQIINNLFVAFYVLFTAITCICYVLILRQVKKHKRVLISLGASGTLPVKNNYAKSLKFFMVVFGVYFIMTCPFCVTSFLLATDEASKQSKITQDIVKCFLILNSATNFVILSIIDRSFRMIVISKLCCCLNRRRNA